MWSAINLKSTTIVEQVPPSAIFLIDDGHDNCSQKDTFLV